MTVTTHRRASRRATDQRNLTHGQDGFVAGCAAAILDHIPPTRTRGRIEIGITDLGEHAGLVLSALRALRHAQLVELDQPDQHSIEVDTSRGHPELVRVLAENFRAVAELATRWSWNDYEQIVSDSARITRLGAAARTSIAGLDAPAHVIERTGQYLDGVHDTIVAPRRAHLDLARGHTGRAFGPAPEPMSRRLSQIYGLTGSYAQPLLNIGRRPFAPFSPDLVNAGLDRALNVIASGAAHHTYFVAAQSILRQLFDNTDFGSQPLAIVDTGSGDGTWLQMIHQFLTERTERGRALHRYPLHLVGIDLSPVAVELTRRAIEPLGGQAFVGDIAEPEQLIDTVRAHTGIPRERQLHVRAFIDHNRALTTPCPASGPVTLNGAFAVSRHGHYQSPAHVAGDWIDHLSRWKQSLGSGTAVIIEAHTPPAPTPDGFGFEFYHTLSGQSPLPWPDFDAAVPISGLRYTQPPRRFSSHGFTNVSVCAVTGTSRTGR